MVVHVEARTSPANDDHHLLYFTTINRYLQPEEIAYVLEDSGSKALFVSSAVAEVASALTPVPGGVGPMTVAMLMGNTLEAALLRRHGASG